MSLPSRIYFLKYGKPVFSLFVNCGWFFEKEKLVDYILESINRKCEYDKTNPNDLLKNVDYDHIVLYNFVIRKTMLQKHLFGDLTNEQFLETVKEEK